MALCPGMTAIVRGGCLSNAALFFETPCLEYWLSLSRLAEGIVLYDNLVFLTHDLHSDIHEKKTVFEKPFMKELIHHGLIELEPMGSAIGCKYWSRIFDRFAAALSAKLPEAVDYETSYELFDDVIRRFHTEGAAFHGLYGVFETGPHRYYDESSLEQEPMGALRQVATKVGLLAVADELGTDLIDDPLEVPQADEVYQGGLAKLNYRLLSELVSDKLASSLPTSEVLSFDLDPISAIAANRALHRKTPYLQEILQLRRDFSTYRQKIGNMASMELANVSIERFLSLRYRLVDEVQAELRRQWTKHSMKFPILESVEAALSDQGSVSLSISSLLTILAKGIRSKLVRMRIRPLFKISDQLKKLPVVDGALKELFNWKPSQIEHTRISRILERPEVQIPNTGFLSRAREDFLAFHKTIPREFKLRIHDGSSSGD